MPRGFRQRGRRHKKASEEQEYARKELKSTEERPLPPIYDQTNATDSKPSWLIPAASQNISRGADQDAPFGFVDAEVKAYFRTVDSQIRDWQETRTEVEGEGGSAEIDPNEGMFTSSVSSQKIDIAYILWKERRLFFVAALTEMRGKEKQLATDPDCSIILERMIYSMDDFIRRVFVDSMAGS